MRQHYIITVRGHLDASWSAWFDSLTVTNAPNGEAVLSGLLPDQATLHGVLGKIRDLGLPLVSLYTLSADDGDRQLDGARVAA